VNVWQAFCWGHGFTRFFGELWVQNLILLGSAGIGIWTLGSGSRQERRRATVDIIRDQLQDVQLISARKMFRELKARNVDLSTFAQMPEAPERLALLAVLNSYEFMAAGLREGAFDEKTYQRMYQTNVIKDWRALEGFAKKYRELWNLPGADSTVYQEFERLYVRWTEHPLKADRRKPI
jgi:hypothetical protein